MYLASQATTAFTNSMTVFDSTVGECRSYLKIEDEAREGFGMKPKTAAEPDPEPEPEA